MPLGRKIIVSDNDREFLAACQKSFQLLDMQVILLPKHGRMLWDAIEKEQPDLVICNIFMSYCDVVHIMEQLARSQTTPFPAFIALCTSDNEFLFDRFLSAGGTYVFVKPLDVTLLAGRVADYLDRMEQKDSIHYLDFSKPVHDPSSDAAELLKAIGVPAHLSGYRYIKIGLSLLYRNPERFSYGTKGLYQAIAEETHTTYHCVERNIRTAVEAAFGRGDQGVCEAFFGSSVNRKRGKPNNVQFIATLYERMRQKRASNS
ncbi:MAG: sporulation initiation factor Spo0A C-terminal domain-containing protein [Oscillospiraceae bacterium]|nr:sporulation initiation factor Spo0A C-terminal domain-containing protein [Oscillospiraceae bacterium]